MEKAKKTPLELHKARSIPAYAISEQIGQLLKNRLICGEDPKDLGIQTNEGWDGKAFIGHLETCDMCYEFVRSLLDEDQARARRFLAPLERPSGYRRVSLRKIRGKEGSPFPVGVEIEGLELWEPEIGRPYILKLESGRFFRTSPIKRLVIGGFETANSSYTLEALPW